MVEQGLEFHHHSAIPVSALPQYTPGGSHEQGWVFHTDGIRRTLSTHPHVIIAPLDAPRTRRGPFEVFTYSRRALELVWTTDKLLSILLALLTLIAGVLPAGIAYVGALIVDAVIRTDPASRQSQGSIDAVIGARQLATVAHL